MVVTVKPDSEQKYTEIIVPLILHRVTSYGVIRHCFIVECNARQKIDVR